MEIIYFYEIETGIEIFSDKNCKLTFGFKYSIPMVRRSSSSSTLLILNISKTSLPILIKFYV